MSTFAQRFYRTKMTLLGVLFAIGGIALIITARWIGMNQLTDSSWLRFLPFAEIGGSLFAIGVVGTAYDYYTRRDEEESAVRRLRETLRREAPVMRDAVISAFAFEVKDLERVATPQLLDDLAQNSLALRFGDAGFAREVYTEIRDQAIKATERWYDARVSIGLSPVPAEHGFNVTVRWEYTVTPKHQFRRFAAVSDRRRYDELAAQAGETSVWFKQPTPGSDITSPASFRLVQFTVGDRERRIDRHVDDSSQTYVVDVGKDVLQDAKPVVISFTYVSRTKSFGHVLHFDIDRPTKGLSLEITYDGCGVDRMRMFDFVSAGRETRVSSQPADTDPKTLRFAYDGWIFPRAGLLFVWTLEAELADLRQLPTTTERAHHTKAA